MQLVATANSSYHSPHQVLLVRKGVGVDGIQDITPGLRVEVHITGKVPRSGHAIVKYVLFKKISNMKKFVTCLHCLFSRWVTLNNMVGEI